MFDVPAPTISIESVEIYWDLILSNSFIPIRQLIPTFRAYFNKSAIDLNNDIKHCVENIYNAIVLKGYGKKGESFKLYTKTLELLRFESTYNKCRIQNICSTNVIENLKPASFEKIFNLLGNNARQYYSIYDIDLDGSNQPSDIYYVLSMLFAAFIDESSLITAICLLYYNRKINSTVESSYACQKLVKVGILIKVAHGLYRLENKYIRPIEAIYNFIIGLKKMKEDISLNKYIIP